MIHFILVTGQWLLRSILHIAGYFVSIKRLFTTYSVTYKINKNLLSNYKTRIE